MNGVVHSMWPLDEDTVNMRFIEAAADILFYSKLLFIAYYLLFTHTIHFCYYSILF